MTVGICDQVAERGVLAGLCEYGSDIYLDICDMVKPSTFFIDSNKIIFACLSHIMKDNDGAEVDLPSILSAAKDLGFTHILERQEEAKHLNSILQLHVERSNVRKFAGKLRKLEVARLIHKQGAVLQERMLEIQGIEPITQILGLAEEVIFDFTSLLDDGENRPQKLGNNIEDYVNYLADNPVERIGIPTGFDEYDEAIGGGLRKATLNVIGARPKTGKTILSDNMGYNIASGPASLPVLNLDTEMRIEDHRHRSLAMISGVKIHDIETGQFGQHEGKKRKVLEAAKLLGQANYYHRSIAGVSFEDQLAMMRRWIQREVGLNDDGTAKDCVIIYDYLKLMEATGISDSMREFQVLGFMMTTLHNFAVRYQIPMIIFMQLNRDGINKETTDAASGSDRIIWLCSNFTIFKAKSEEEIAEDGPNAGNRKLNVLVTRHGEGLDWNDYINVNMKGYCAQIKEIGRRSKPNPLEEAKPDDFQVNTNDDIPFD